MSWFIADENGTLIYEEAASDNSNVAFDGQQSANNQLNSSANLSNNTVQHHQQPGSKIAIQGTIFFYEELAKSF